MIIVSSAVDQVIFSSGQNDTWKMNNASFQRESFFMKWLEQIETMKAETKNCELWTVNVWDYKNALKNTTTPSDRATPLSEKNMVKKEKPLHMSERLQMVEWDDGASLSYTSVSVLSIYTKLQSNALDFHHSNFFPFTTQNQQSFSLFYHLKLSSSLHSNHAINSSFLDSSLSFT